MNLMTRGNQTGHRLLFYRPGRTATNTLIIDSLIGIICTRKCSAVRPQRQREDRRLPAGL